jgi:hypothetical protein
MASYFISAHGMLKKEGSRKTQAKFIVPKGVSIYFFSPSGTQLNADYSDFIMDVLVNNQCTGNIEKQVQEAAYEVVTEGELCFNYTSYEDANGGFRQLSGLYRIGHGLTPIITLPPGQFKTLQQWVSGIGGGDSAFGNCFYWGACREHENADGVLRNTPNTKLFKVQQATTPTMRTATPAMHRPAAYNSRYGDLTSPISNPFEKDEDGKEKPYQGFLWRRDASISSKEKTMAANPAELRKWLARLKQGEGLLG